MQINAIKMFQKKLPPKTSFTKFAWVERVASSARLPGIKGTERQRNQLAYDLNNKLFVLINDIFESKIKMNQKPALEKNELQDCIKQIIPNIKVKVKYKKMADCIGFLEPLADKSKKVAGYCLNLNEKLEKGINDDTLRHEARHLFDFVTQPKTIARTNTQSLTGRLENYTEKIDMKHFDFYSDKLYTDKVFKNDEKELEILTKKIKKYFNKSKTTSDEKIEILQNWRGGLISEIAAYTDEAIYMNKENPGKILDQTLKELFLEPKLKLIEQILKDEIIAVRKISAEKFGKKQIR